MKRLFVVDDERPVVEGIVLMTNRDLRGEFEVVGTASSGREAIERAPAIAPDIVLMDVRMPGISGLDAIRELRHRGVGAVFILVTAYERFDIAREAVELGVFGYLLKPVTRDDLARTLGAASAHIDRLRNLESREVEHREAEGRFRGFAEAAWLAGIMLGEDASGQAAAREALGVSEQWVAALAVAFLPATEGEEPSATIRSLYHVFRDIIRYRSTGLVGPLVAGRSLAIVTGRDAEIASRRLLDLELILGDELGPEIARGRLRMGSGGPRAVADAFLAWGDAVERLVTRNEDAAECPPQHHASSVPQSAPPDGSPVAVPFDADEEFLAAFREFSPARISLALDRLVAPLEALPSVPGSETGRIVALLATVARSLARRGAIDSAGASRLMDPSGLSGLDGPGFRLVVQARVHRLQASLGSVPRHSAPVVRAVAWVRENYGKPAGLEACAEAVRISPNRLSRLFVEETGRGFSDFLIECRITRARQMLSEPGWSIKEVAAACGYSDPNYFARLFKKSTGLTPSAFAAGSHG